MAFTLPDKGEGQNDIQSILFQEYLDVLVSEGTDFVVSGCLATAQGSPSMVVSISTGIVFTNGARFDVTGANVTHAAANATNPRIDLIVVTNAGALAIRAGTAAAAPKPGIRSANDVALATVFIPANDTTISTDQITDLRIIMPNLVGEKIRFPALPAIPSAPATNELYVYARNIGGRMLLKWQPPSGLDTPVQPALFGNNIILFTPTTGTTLGGFGTTWIKGAGAQAVTTPTISTSAPVFMNSMKRLRHSNVVTTTNQELGVVSTAASGAQFWRGNAAGLGGFYFFCRFAIGIWLSGCRIFVGMAASGTTPVVGDTLTNNCAGLSKITTDGTSTLFFRTRDGTTTSTTTITGATIATGAVFDVYMFHKPNDSTLYFRVDEIDNGSGTNLGTLIDSSTASNLPVNTTILGPCATMSNGTANITVSTVAMDVNRIYVESDH